MTIAIDFDGTIVEHKYPRIGREYPFALATLRKLAQEGHKLILWTVREGEQLAEAIEFCRAKGVEFYAINSNYPDASLEADLSARKLKVDLFIDDRNLGGLPLRDRSTDAPDWSAIYEIIHNNLTIEEYYKQKFSDKLPQKCFWDRLFNR